MRLHWRFEWDKKKAVQNLRRHGVMLDDAAVVLGQEDGDFYLIEDYDDEHSNKEDRYCTFGSHPEDRGKILRISWTDRTDEEGQVTRIISVRGANSLERKLYAEQIQRRNRS